VATEIGRLAAALTGREKGGEGVDERHILPFYRRALEGSKTGCWCAGA
jgi:hypothetical protein